MSSDFASLQGNFFMSSQNNKRLNITLIGDEVDLIEQLQTKLNAELKLKLSMAQIVKRLIRQATAHN